MLGGSHRRFRPPWIQHNDFRRLLISQYAFPHNGMTNTRVRPHEYKAITRLKVGIRIGRCIEPKRFLVSYNSGGHTLPRVAIAMLDSHSKLGKRT